MDASFFDFKKLKPLAEGAEWFALRGQRLDFRLRATGLQLQRAWCNARDTFLHGPFPRLAAPLRVDDAGARMAFVRAESRTPLWTHRDDREWRLTAGKVHNLRTAARALDGLVVPAGAVFSFWAAVGQPSARRGYVPGRELREGCLIASVAGGLCQLSNALYTVALDAGAVIVERHAHSRAVPGSQAALGRDATVFWNYLDLRFYMAESFELEARLDADELIVRLRALSPALPRVHGRMRMPDTRAAVPLAVAMVNPGTTPPARDCGSCSRTTCPDRFVAEPTRGGVRAAVPARWPEHMAWTRAQRVEVLSAVDKVTGWRVHAMRTLAWLVRRRPAAWRRSVLALHDARARAWAASLDADCAELIVPVDWLATLQCDGVLQGRRYSVLMTRQPLAWLHERLDAAAGRLQRDSLLEYRASPARVVREIEALRGASRLVTPHVELAARLRAWSPRAEVVALRWHGPEKLSPAAPGRRILFPASALARMGAVELREACLALQIDHPIGLDVLGRAEEDTRFWHGLDVRRADPAVPWRDIGVVVLPAWVESAPRLLVEALARGLPVIATPACGLSPDRRGLRIVPVGDARAIAAALSEVLAQALDNSTPGEGRPRCRTEIHAAAASRACSSST
ncbi:MAG: VanW family protein [Rhizobacter sp.]